MNIDKDYRRSRQLLSLTIIFFWASEYCHAPYFTPYLMQLGFAADVIGFVTGAYGFTQTLVRIPLGMATDATGAYKRTILLGTVFTTVSSFGLMFATELVPVLICRVLAGMAASTWLAFTVLYNAYFSTDESVRAMTNVNAFNNAGKFLAFILGMVTSSLWGYRIPLVCSFLTGCVAIVLALNLKPVSMKREPFRPGHVLVTLKNAPVLVAALFAVITQFYMQGTVFSFTSAVAENLNAGGLEIGLSTVLYTAVQVAGAGIIGGKLLKKLDAAKAVTLGCIILVLSAVLIAFAGMMPMIYLGQILAGIGNLMLNSVLMSMVVRHTPQERQSTAMGLYQAIYGLGMAAGPVMVGQMVSSSTYRSAYLAVAAMMAAAAVLAPFLIYRVDHRKTN